MLAGLFSLQMCNIFRANNFIVTVLTLRSGSLLPDKLNIQEFLYCWPPGKQSFDLDPSGQGDSLYKKEVPNGFLK